MIGLGRIGQLYDYSLSNQSMILTHAHAFAAHPGYELVAGVDPDSKKRKLFEKKYRRPAYSNLKMLRESKQDSKIDVMALSIPTDRHLEIFQQAIQLSPRGIILEKPLATNVQQGNKILRLARDKKCTVLVNYVRRFEPGVQKLRRQILRSEWGEIYKGIVWYSKGVNNSASHYIDLLQFILGKEASRVSLIAKRKRGKDPDLDFVVRFEKTDIIFLATRSENFSFFEMELLGEKGRIVYSRRGSRIYSQKAQPDPIFDGYRILNRKTEIISNRYYRYQWHVAQNMYEHLTKGKSIYSSEDSALKTLKIVEKIICLA